MAVACELPLFTADLKGDSVLLYCSTSVRSPLRRHHVGWCNCIRRWQSQARRVGEATSGEDNDQQRADGKQNVAQGAYRCRRMQQLGHTLPIELQPVLLLQGHDGCHIRW